MISQYAHIDEITNIVVNVSLWDGITTWSPPEGIIVVQSDTAGIDDIYDPETGTFTRP